MTDHIRARVISSSPPHPTYEGQDELFDWQKWRRYAMFSLGSVRRRPFLFAFVFCGMVLLAAGALAVLPKTYEVESRLLAQKNPVLAVRADANQMDQPTRAAAETIIRRENLQALISQTELVQEWPKRRAPILRFKDWVLRALKRETTEKELAEGLTGLLEKNLTVWTTPDGTVVIKLHWPDALMAYRLVDAAEQNFLEKRHVLEISTIAEQISIFEGHAATLKNDIEAQVADLERMRQDSTPKRSASPAPRPRTRIDPDVLNLRVTLEGKRRAIADLEESRRRHFSELQTRLAEQRAVYSENHPMLVDLQRSIDSLRQESPQLSALRQEERELRRQLSELPGGGEGAMPSAPPEIPADLFRGGDEHSSVEYARAQLRYAAQQYAAMRERIDSARIDLDTARAAFKYRYSVVIPPQVPRGPIKPKAPLVMAEAVIAGLLLALFATTFADFRAGVVLKRWQLEDLLGQPGTIVDVRLPWPPSDQLPPPESSRT
ncbi:MAG TPA: hypothetical protein VII08_14305 [Myxococcales bacterium]